MEEVSPESAETEIRVYKYRWVVLFIFCLFTIINFIQFLQFSIIGSIIKPYYDIDQLLSDLSGLIFFIVYIITFIPVSYLIERYSLRFSAVVSTGLTLIGNLIKLLAANPNRYSAVLVGQGLCALGQVFMMSIPSKFASVWFGPEEVSTACAIAVLGTQLGAALGCVIPTFLVFKGTTEEVGDDIMRMMIINSSLTGFIFLLVLIFFRGKPKLPPSLSQVNLLFSENKNEIISSFLELMRNKNFLLLLFSFGISNGIWNSFGLVINDLYIEYFPDGEQDAGIIGLIAIIAGGCFGSIIFGIILDKTHQFKKSSFGILLASSVTLIGVLFSLYYKSKIATYFAIPLFGFFAASALMVGFEFTLEATYPIPESASCSVLNAFVYLYAILNTLLMKGLFNWIGYVATMVIQIVLFFLTAVNIFFVSDDLRRRNANLLQTQY